MRIGPLLCLAVLVVALTGCGGGSAGGTSTASRRLPHTLALDWARRADAVAAAAAAGDACGAHRLAVSLQAAVIRAEGRVPARFQTVLTRAVDHLAEQTACPPPPPQTVTKVVTAPQHPSHPPHGGGPPHGHGHKGDGHGHGGDGG